MKDLEARVERLEKLASKSLEVTMNRLHEYQAWLEAEVKRQAVVDAQSERVEQINAELRAELAPLEDEAERRRMELPLSYMQDSEELLKLAGQLEFWSDVE